MPGARPAPRTRCWPRGAAPGRSTSRWTATARATTFAFADGRLRRRRHPAVHPGRARRGLGEVPGPDSTAAPSRIFAMLARVPEFAVRGDQLAFMQHCHVVRRVLEIGKWLALGHAAPAPASLHPPLGVRDAGAGRDRRLRAGDRRRQHLSDLLRARPGSGRDLLCLHTAGADGRQFHRLMADPRITASHRMVAFDLPWHGKSPPPAGAIPGSWRLNTDLYVDADHGLHRRRRPRSADRARRLDVGRDLPGTRLPSSGCVRGHHRLRGLRAHRAAADPVRQPSRRSTRRISCRNGSAA